MQQHRVNVSSENLNQHWKQAIFLLFIDHLFKELCDRLTTNEDIFLARDIVHSVIDCLTFNVTTLCLAFSDTILDKFKREVRLWKPKWNSVDDAEKLDLLRVPLHYSMYILHKKTYVFNL